MSIEALPIDDYLAAICDALEHHDVVIVQAETGAGKSTRVPQALLQFGRVVVTQPRRLAARSVAGRVAQEANSPLGSAVGWRVAGDGQFSDQTRCLFVTDGLQLVRELMGRKNYDVLVLDEVHEWSTNLEVLVAWAERQISSNPAFKLVLMSATLEAEKLSAYFGGAPIISVPGRVFPVTELPRQGATLEDDVVRLLRQGHNVLVFQPGVGEINNCINVLQSVEGLEAEILPLHGGMTPEEQDLCFRRYGRPKCVVATNVAQTSITIPDITAVVDSGLERRTELTNGNEGLHLLPISLADRDQRKGRAGRTGPGVYIDWCPHAERREFPKAEIERTRLDQLVLRLAAAGMDIEELRFFHQPALAEIHDAKRALVALGCLEANGRITSVGRRISKMRIAPKYGSMIIEAEKSDDQQVVGAVITAAAILAQKGVAARACSSHQAAKVGCICWWNLVKDIRHSELLAQLVAFMAMRSKSNQEMRAAGMSPRDVRAVREQARLLAMGSNVNVQVGELGDPVQNWSKILRAICAGMVDDLFERGEYDHMCPVTGAVRELDKKTPLLPDKWVIGVPFDLSGKTGKVSRRVLLGSNVNPEVMADVAPHLVTTVEEPPSLTPGGELAVTVRTIFNGHCIKVESRALSPDHPTAVQFRKEQNQQEQFCCWTDRPEIAFDSETDDLPAIATHAYGVDADTGEPLIAYGVIVFRVSFNGPPFATEWYRSLADAQSRLEQAAEVLQRRRQQSQHQREASDLSAIKAEVNKLRETLGRLARNIESSLRGLSRNLRDDLRRSGSLFPWGDNIAEWRSSGAAAMQLLERIYADLEVFEALRLRAQKLRDQANNLLVDHPDLPDSLYDSLAGFDVEDQDLPLWREDLAAWVNRAEQAVARVNRRVQLSVPSAPPAIGGVSADAIAALAARFGGKK